MRIEITFRFDAHDADEAKQVWDAVRTAVRHHPGPDTNRRGVYGRMTKVEAPALPMAETIDPGDMGDEPIDRRDAAWGVR